MRPDFSRQSLPSPAERAELTFLERARRVQIVECTIDSLVDVGYEKSSIAEIARRVEGTPSLVLYHFANRCLIMEQVLVMALTAINDWVRPELQAAETATEMLRALIRSCVTFAGPHRRLAKAMREVLRYRNVMDNDRGLADATRAGMIEDIAAILRWGVSTGEFCIPDVRVAGRAIHDAIDGFYARLIVEETPLLEEYGDELAALFLRAVCDSR